MTLCVNDGWGRGGLVPRVVGVGRWKDGRVNCLVVVVVVAAAVVVVV